MNRSKILHGLVGLTALVITGWLVIRWWPDSSSSVTPIDAPASDDVPQVHLTAAKAIAAGIRTEPVARRSLELTRTLPARFLYNDRQHVAVRTPTDGVIDNLLVKPGDQVAAGDFLAILQSPSIGTARAEVLRRQADLDLLESRRLQVASIQSGVASLVDALRAGNPPAEIQRKLGDATLGQYRASLLANYSKQQFARQLSEAAAGSAGAISGRIVQERISEEQQARAEFEGAVEQAIFETDQAFRGASSDVDAARRSLSIAHQELAMLLGVTRDEFESLSISPNDLALTRLEIRSPIAGTVERINYSATERVKGGDELFVVADTSRLWVEGDVRGRDWGAIDVTVGRVVTVTTPAEPHKVMAATVYFVGREVDPATGAIPLVAEIENPTGKLRPGQFARMEIGVDTVDDILAIPRSAVVDLQGEASVFVALDDGGFQPAAVQAGATSAEWIEVRAGLREGQQIVVEGAFILKSELLLEGEE